MFSGTASMILSVAVSAVKYPLYIHFIGYEGYGVWLLLYTIITFAQMGLLGIGPALVKLIAEEYGKKNYKVIQNYFSTAIVLLLSVSSLILIIGLLFKTELIALSGLEGQCLKLMTSLFLPMLFLSIGVLAYQVLNSILAGLGRMDLANYWQTGVQGLSLIFSIPLLLWDKGVESLLIGNIAAYLMVFFINYRIINNIVRIRILFLTNFSKKCLYNLISFGGVVFAGATLNMMVLPITKILITRTIGVNAVPILEITYRVGAQLRSLFETAFRALMPEISTLWAVKNDENLLKIKVLRSKSNRIIFWGAAPFFLLIFASAEIIFKLWLGQNFDPDITIVFRILLVTFFLNLLVIVRYYELLGTGMVKKIFLYQSANALVTLLSIGILVLISKSIALSSIAWCFVFGAFISSIYLLLSGSTTNNQSTEPYE